MKTNIMTITLMDGSTSYGAVVDLVVVGEICNGNMWDYWREPEFAHLAKLLDGRWAVSDHWDEKAQTVVYKPVERAPFESAGLHSRKGGKKMRRQMRRVRIRRLKGADKLPF